MTLNRHPILGISPTRYRMNTLTMKNAAIPTIQPIIGSFDDFAARTPGQMDNPKQAAMTGR